MIRLLKCKLGFHDWFYGERRCSCEPTRRYCKVCERIERQVPAEWLGLTDIWTLDKLER